MATIPPDESRVESMQMQLACLTQQVIPSSLPWWAKHQPAQTLLDLGAKLGYPRILVSWYRAIGAGRGSWEAYASRAPDRWLRHDLPFIRSHYPNGTCGTSVELGETNYPA